jgi:hypothetical protein
MKITENYNRTNVRGATGIVAHKAQQILACFDAKRVLVAERGDGESVSFEPTDILYIKATSGVRGCSSRLKLGNEVRICSEFIHAWLFKMIYNQIKK